MSSGLLSPDFSRCFQEFRSGSRDGVLLGLKVIGNALKELSPEIYQLPELQGQRSFILRKKACVLLSSLAKNEALEIKSDAHLQHQIQSIGFLTKLALNYGSALTKKTCSSIDPPFRQQIEQGESTFGIHHKQAIIEKLQSQLDQEVALPKQMDLPSLPSELERYAYWKQVQLAARSKEGHIGVFYTYSPAFQEDLVVKAPNRAAQECFASRIFQSLELMTPDTIVVDRFSEEGMLIEKALKGFKEFQTHCQEVPFKKFFIMNRIHGRSFEEIDEATAKSAFTNDRLCFYSLLEQIGIIAAVDVFIHYQDRFSHIGYSNLGNLMCLEQLGGRITTAVAIDQSVDLSKPYSGFLVAKTKIEVIQETLTDVVNSKNEISKAAKALWTDIPEHLKQYGDEREALHHLHQGLLSGFQLIVQKISPHTLHKIDHELKPNYTDLDCICIGDLENALTIIKTHLSQL